MNTLEINTSENKAVLSTYYEIIIGCAPFKSRPDSILTIVLLDTKNKLTINDFQIVSKLYGDWIFIPLKEKENIYLENQDIIGEKLKQLYLTGHIRCAEW